MTKGSSISAIGREQAFAGHEIQLVSGVSQKAFGEELAADHDVPAHREDTDQGQAAGRQVHRAAPRLGDFQSWVAASRSSGTSVPKQDLEDDLRAPQPRVHHEVEAAEGLVGFVGAVDEVEHLQREVDDEGVEEIACAMVSMQRMSIGIFLTFMQTHVEHHDRGDAGDHGGEEEHDRHQRRGPPGIGFDGAEDEADISVEQERRGDTDDGDGVARPCRR